MALLRDLVLFSAFVGLSACATGDRAGGAAVRRGPPKRVVLISIDGLRPEFYLSGRFNTPNLHAIAREGTWASSVRPVFPSQTYPNHATLITGVLPREHGILSNRVFSFEAAPRDDVWYWYASEVKARTLWQSAKAAGRKVAIIRWPSTVGADVDWILPEIFASPGIDLKRDWKKVSRITNPKFLSEALRYYGRDRIDSTAELDEFAASSAQMVLSTDHPDFMLLHFIEADLAQHKTGRDSMQTRKAIEMIDRLVGQIRKSLASSPSTALVIVGDHGFADYDGVIHLNELFRERGWLAADSGRVTSWSVVAEGDGGQAAIYAKNQALASAAERLLRERARSLYALVSRAELDRRGAYPGAAFAVVAKKGYVIDNAAGDSLVTREKTVLGQHGYDSDMPEMSTGFLAVGNGIAADRNLGAIDILDVAPTVAALLDVPLPSAHGAVLDLLSKK